MIEATISRSQPSLGSRIVRGTVSAFILNVLSYGSLFVGQILIARLLSHLEYAEFTVSISFVGLMALIADLGMNPLFTRLFAQSEEQVLSGGIDRRGTLLGSALTLRVSLSVVVALLVTIVSPMLYPARVCHTMSILLISLLISSRLVIVRSVGDSVLRGRGKYYLTALFGLFDALAFALLMILATYRHFVLDEVIWIYVLCNVPGFVLLVRSIAVWLQREHISLRVDWSTMQELLRFSVPLVLGTALFTVYTQIDNILLYHLSTPFEVSNYGVSIRLSTALSAFAFVLAAVTAPEITRLLHRGDETRAKQLLDVSLRLLLVSGAAIAIIVTATAYRLIPSLLGSKYAAAAPLFIWTGWMLLPVFISTLMMEISVAANEAWFMTANAGIAMCFVIVGDLLLIPSHGATGAMFGRLLASALGAIAIVWLSRRSDYFDARKFNLATAKTGLASGAALLGFWFIQSNTNSTALSLLIGLGIFYTSIHFSNVLPLKEVRALSRRIRKTNAVSPNLE